MFKILFLKCKEAMISVLPVTVLVVLLNVTPLVCLTALEITVFLVSSLFLVLGIGFFNLGADIAMTPMGVQVGAGLSKSRSVGVLLSVSFLLGVLITVAEPDLSVLAAQVSAVVNGTALIAVVGVGVGLFLVLAILRIVTNTGLSQMLMIF